MANETESQDAPLSFDEQGSQDPTAQNTTSTGSEDSQSGPNEKMNGSALHPPPPPIPTDTHHEEGTPRPSQQRVRISTADNRPSIATHTTSPTAFFHTPTPYPDGPPPLDYDLYSRRWWILAFWILILVDCIGIPIILYFTLWYCTNLTPNAVFSISTGALGGVSIVEYFLRFYRLWKKGSTCRVVGARRWYLDWFHWNFSAAWIFIMAELIIGTVFEDPPLRLLAMPVSSLCFWFGFQLLIEDSMRYLGYRQPVRISSVPKGQPFRPGIYSIIEDVIAVDGSGGTEFRDRLNKRYEASKAFRYMLHRLTLFWAFGTLMIASLTTALVFTLSRDASYVIGWSLPFVWASIWTLCTFWYVFRCLRIEKKYWGKPERRFSTWSHRVMEATSVE